MNQDKRNIDKLFKDGLKGVREKPPVHAWDRLNHDLDMATYKKPIFYFRWVAAVALILIAFGAGYLIATLNNNPNLQSANNQEKTPLNELTNSDQDAFENSTDLTIQDTKSESSSNLTLTKSNTLNAELENRLNKVSISNQDNELSSNELIVVNESFRNKDNLKRVHWNSFDHIEIESLFRPHPIIQGESLANNSEVSASQYLNSATKPINRLNEYQYNDPVKNKNDQIWVVGAQFAPVISYRDISNTYGTQNNGSSNQRSDMNSNEEALLSYAGGVDVNFHINKKWSLQSGAYYSRIGQVNSDALKFNQENNDYLLFAINTSTGKINIAFEKVPDDVRKITPPKDTLEALDIGDVKVVQNFDLFEIPFMLRYKFLHKKLSISFAGGLSPAYLIDNTTYLEVENTKYDIGSSSNLNSMIINSSFSLGFDVALSKKFSFNFEPTFKYSLNPLNSDSQFDYHPYYLSWFTGVKYTF